MSTPTLRLHFHGPVLSPPRSLPHALSPVAEMNAAEEVLIVTSSLMKDMNGKVELFRANAVRVLCKIIDGNMLSQVERFIKQAIVDKNQLVSCEELRYRILLSIILFSVWREGCPKTDTTTPMGG